MTEPVPAPEAVLIESTRRLGPLSIRAAATSAHISEGRWRQIVRGGVAVGDGHYAPVKLDSQKVIETLARMANAVGVPVESMDEVGRLDVAARMGELLEANRSQPASTMSNGELLAELARRMDVDLNIPAQGRTPGPGQAEVEVEETAPQVAHVTVRTERSPKVNGRDARATT